MNVTVTFERQSFFEKKGFQGGCGCITGSWRT
jgi:hypothetical protein